MRVVLILGVLLSTSAFAKKNEKSFLVAVSGNFSKSWFRITPEGNKWVCQTANFPRYVAPKYPLAELDWKALEAEGKARPKDCEYKLAFKDRLGAKDRKVLTCLSQPHSAKIYAAIQANCKSKI